VELYRRQHRTGVRLANDSSCGVGYAPLSTLETVTYQIGRRLSSDLAGRSLPALGQDVKVMGIRQGSALSITVAAALVGRFLENAEAYMETKATLALPTIRTKEASTSRSPAPPRKPATTARRAGAIGPTA
jgi:S-adenosylmethionine synthetase